MADVVCPDCGLVIGSVRSDLFEAPMSEAVNAVYALHSCPALEWSA